VVSVQWQIQLFFSSKYWTGHEFNISATLNSEVLVCNVIEYIKQNENPVAMPEADVELEQPLLHNIVTQEIVSSEIRDDLLNFKTKSSSLYDKICCER